MQLGGLPPPLCVASRSSPISARPALRWPVPLFSVTWRTSAAATRRLQKLTNLRTSCASLVRATVLCSLADFRRRYVSPPEAHQSPHVLRFAGPCHCSMLLGGPPPHTGSRGKVLCGSRTFLQQLLSAFLGARGVFFTRERIPLPPLFSRFPLPGNGADAGKIKVAQLLSKLAVPGLAGNVHHPSVCIRHDGGIALIVPNPHAFP